MEDAQLLGEVEELIRTQPPINSIMWATAGTEEWIGRASALMEEVGPSVSMSFNAAVLGLGMHATGERCGKQVVQLLHKARTKLRLTTVGPVNSAIGAGAVFDYFDEVRKIIETASVDLFFVDAYMGAEFVSRYLPHVKSGVRIRLLTKKMVAQLVPALQTFRPQHGASLEARTCGSDIHDRWVFVDNSSCYQSGASFKDGAVKSPTTLTQLQDMFAVVHQQYESIWAASAAIPL